MARKRTLFVLNREAQGFTQESLAEQLGVDRSTVLRWESGQTRPQPWLRSRIARALDVSATELDRLLRTVVDDEAVAAGAQTVTAGRGILDTARLRTDYLAVVDRYDSSPSAGLLSEAGQLLSRVALTAEDARGGRAARDLRILHAEAATFMGQLVWDASQRTDHATARAFYWQGVSLARQLRDPAVEGRALLRTGYVALYGERDAHKGLHLAQQAAEAARSISPALSGVALLHVGEAHAMLGQARDCERALASAEQELACADDTDVAADMVSATQFGRLAGSCYLSLGQHRRAQQHLEATAQQLRLRQKSRAIVLGNLTLAHIRQGDVDAAVAVLGDAIDELEETRGGGGMNVVFAAARELRPWHTSGGVQDIHDRLFALMTAP